MTDDRSKQINKKRLAKVQDYQKFFSTEHGKRVMYDLFNAHGMMRPTFSKDPMELAFNEGERNVILRILSILKTSPEKLVKQIEESDEYANQSII